MANIPGQKTIDEMQSECAMDLFQNVGASANSFPTNTYLTQIINDNYRRLAGANDWKWLYQETTLLTVAGQKTYCPDTINGASFLSVRNILGMKIESLPRHIRYYSRQRFVNEFPKGWSGISNQSPTIWLPSGEPAASNAMQFDLWPIPDQVYTITYFYQGRVADLALSQNPASFFLCPPDFQDIIKFLTLAQCWAMKNDQFRSQWNKAQADAIYARAWVDDAADRQGIETLRDLWAENLTTGAGVPGLIYPYLNGV